MVRVMVIGNAAGGKSTVCRAICAAHDLPYHEIDRLRWQPGWVPVADDVFRDVHDTLVSDDRWLIDGYGPWETVQSRLAACDTVVFVDHPIRVHFWWAAKRQVKSLIFGRPDGPDGCSMWRVTIPLFRMMWSVHRDLRPRLIDTLDQHSDTVRLIHIRSPQELNQFARNPV